MKIPANLIFGHLGVGKTTTINHLLKSKPEKERWGVIVNEFGDVGVDGEIISQQEEAVIEVPGGCMCCSATLPSAKALKHLINHYDLTRILIEPTGLAHPRNVITTFTKAQFNNLIDLQATVCIVDPWYFEHNDYQTINNYSLQLSLADVIVANRCDISTERSLERLTDVAHTLNINTIHKVKFGQLAPSVLKHPRKSLENSNAVAHLASQEKKTIQRQFCQQIISNHKLGSACGWLFDDEYQLSDNAKQWFENLPIDRVKGLVRTNNSWFFVNKTRTSMEWEKVPSNQSTSWSKMRLEMLHSSELDWAKIGTEVESFIVVK